MNNYMKFIENISNAVIVERIKEPIDYIVKYDTEIKENTKTKLKMKEEIILKSSIKNNKISNELGDTLIEFLNNFRNIFNCYYQKEIYAVREIIKSKAREQNIQKAIENAEIISIDLLDENNGIKKCEKFIDELFLDLNKIEHIENILAILEYDINFPLNDSYEYIKFKRNNLLNTIEYINLILNNRDKKIDSNTLLNKLKELEIEFDTANNPNSILNEYFPKIYWYMDELVKFYRTFTKSFITTSEIAKNRKANKFIGNELKISPVNVKIDTESKKIVEYNYKLDSLTDLLSVSLYHLILNNQVITRCQYCNKYFIPKTRNNEIYCHNLIGVTKDNEPIYCSDIGKRKKYETKRYDVYRLYKNLFDRLKQRIKNNDNNKEDYTNKLNYLKENYKKISDEYNIKLDNIRETNSEKYEEIKNKLFSQKRLELNKFLVDFDKKFQKQYPLNNGKHYISQKYWKQNNNKIKEINIDGITKNRRLDIEDIRNIRKIDVEDVKKHKIKLDALDLYIYHLDEEDYRNKTK